MTDLDDAFDCAKAALVQPTTIAMIRAILETLRQRVDAAMAASKKTPCIGKDRYCPCQDGDACHYVALPGSPAMRIPASEVRAILPSSAPVPGGWQLVPIEPTTEMLDAAGEVETHRDDLGYPYHMLWGEAGSAYRLMLKAAPEPPTTPPAEQGAKP